MHRPLITCILGLLACEACASDPGSALPNPIDVSGDDCTASVLVYAEPPSELFDEPLSERTEGDLGTAFINDGCASDRIFLGIDGSRRELKRTEKDLPLGEGGAYSDGEYRVLVKRGRSIAHEEVCPPGAACHNPAYLGEPVAYEAQVRVWSKDNSWSIAGTLLETY